MFKKEKSIILAKDVNIPLTKKSDANVFVYGNQEDGKYESYIVPNIYNLLGNYIIIDNNDKIFNKTNQYMKANGYNIFKYDINKYNPFENVDWNLNLNIDFFTNTIIKNNYNYKKSSNEKLEDILFRCIIYYNLLINENKVSLSICKRILYDLLKGDLSITKIFNILQNNVNIDKSIDALIQFEDLEVRKVLINEYIEILIHLNDIEIKSIIQNLIAILGNIKENDLNATEIFNLKQTCIQKSIVYIQTSSKLYLNSMFFTQMMWNLFGIAQNNNGVMPFDTLLILDNFESLGYIFGYDKIISTSRSRHIYHSLIIDDWFSFRNLYNDIGNILMKNISSGIFLKDFNFELSENLFPVTNNDKIQIIKSLIPKEKCIVYQKIKNHNSSERNPNILQIRNKYHNKRIERKLENYATLNETKTKLLNKNNI